MTHINTHVGETDQMKSDDQKKFSNNEFFILFLTLQFLGLFVIETNIFILFYTWQIDRWLFVDMSISRGQKLFMSIVRSSPGSSHRFYSDRKELTGP